MKRDFTLRILANRKEKVCLISMFWTCLVSIIKK